MENLNTQNKTKKPNPWLLHVKAVREQNPDVSYKDVLTLAKDSYKKDDSKVNKKSKSPKREINEEINEADEVELDEKPKRKYKKKTKYLIDEN